MGSSPIWASVSLWSDMGLGVSGSVCRRMRGLLRARRSSRWARLGREPAVMLLPSMAGCALTHSPHTGWVRVGMLP